MASSRRYVYFVLLCMVLPIFQSPFGSAEPISNVHELSIFQDDGLVFNETLSLNGTSNYQLADSSWFLIDLTETDFEDMSVLASGTLTNVMAVEEEKWSWSVELNVTMYNCTCGFLTIEQSSFNPPLIHRELIEKALIVYLGSTNHQPYILPFFPFDHNMESARYLLTNEDLVLQVPLILPASIANDSFVHLEVCSVGMIFCLGEMVSFENYIVVQEGRELSLLFEREHLNLSDGYWKFSITVVDAILHTSNMEYFTILIDQNLPTVSLTCDRSEISPGIILIDEFSEISFSALVADGYSGGNTILTWTLSLPDGSRRALLPTEQVSDNLISLQPMMAGSWSVELLVRDTAGWLVHSSLEFEVYNRVPIIQLELDSFVITEGSKVTLVKGEIWELNGSKRFDTGNDYSNLIYTWYVNGNTFLTGKNTLESSDFPGTGTYDLRLVVEDNDGAKSELSFEVLISEAASTESSNANTMFVSVFILLVFLFIAGYLVRTSRRRTNQTTVPKWTAKISSEELTASEEYEQ